MTTSTFETPVLDRLTSVAPEASRHLSTALAVKGALALLFGAVLLIWPAPTVLAMVVVFGAFAIAEGVVGIWTGFTATPSDQKWPVVLQGTAGVLTGIVALVWPGATAVVVLYLIAIWTLVKGIAELVLAYRLHQADRSWGWVATAGVLAVLFGVGVAINPGSGAIAVIGLIAALALVTGVATIAGAVTLHHRRSARTEATR